MRTKRSMTGFIAAMIVAGPLAIGPVVVPDTYHDMGNPPSSQSIVAAESVTTPDTDGDPDTYHDM